MTSSGALAGLLALGCVITGCRANWDGHDAHRHCAGAVAGDSAAPAWTCEATMMCANEGMLTVPERARLEAVRLRLGCPAP